MLFFVYLCVIFGAQEMDIDLFSDIVKNLILDNDQVTLPGLGTFVSEVMPSTFSDKGYTINPPYRRLSFRQRWEESDTLLVDFYSESNGIDSGDAERIISGFISGLRETLQSKKLVLLPGLGRLRATKENIFFFIADEDLDIHPEGFGLRPVSLKTHEETADEVSEAVRELKEIVTEDPSPDHSSSRQEVQSGVQPAMQPVVQPTVQPEVQSTEQPKPQPEPQPAAQAAEVPAGERSRSVWPKVFKALLWILGLVILFLVAFILMSRFAPDFTDSLLYTEEELRIINY